MAFRYEYRCGACRELTEAVRSVADRNDCPTCACGGETRKIISLHKAHSDLTPYYDDTLETYITSKQHRHTVMKKQGVSENYGQGWWTSARKLRQTK